MRQPTAYSLGSNAADAQSTIRILHGGELVRERFADLGLEAQHVHRELAEIAGPVRPVELRAQLLFGEIRALIRQHAKRGDRMIRSSAHAAAMRWR